MEDFFEKILNKPKAYRRRLVYILTFAFGVIIFSLWIFMTIDNFQNTVGDVNKNQNLNQEIPSLKEKYQEQVNENEVMQKELEELGL